MITARYILPRLLLTVAFIGLTSWIYSTFIRKLDIDYYAPLLHKLWSESARADVLYLVESSNATYADTDTDTSSVIGLAAQHFPGKTFASIDQPAGHAANYLALLKQIPNPAKVRTVIVSMNLRSFGADWINARLENNLGKINLMYAQGNPLLNKLKLNFDVYNKKTWPERQADREYAWTHDTLRFPFPHEQVTVRAWDDHMANGTYLKQDGSWDQEKISLACHFIKSYGFQIDTLKNPRIRDFDEIVKVAREKKLNLVFNLLSENVHYADSLAGKPLSFLMRQNRDLLVNRYTRMGVTVIDNLETVKSKDFIDQNWTTEHYFYEGRKAMADTIAKYIEPIIY